MDYKAKGLKEAETALNFFNMSESQRKEHDRYMENKRLQASMINSSIIRAEKAEAENVVMHEMLKSAGFSDQQIAEKLGKN